MVCLFVWKKTEVRFLDEKSKHRIQTKARDLCPEKLQDQPYIPPSTNLPEITVKAVILGVILSIVMGGANAYLGLKVGSTVSACIPSAVISLSILKLFRTSNILENNIVQTTASAGEGMVAKAVVFTLPALVMIGYWDHFPALLVTCITVVGGFLGVLLSVPLRRALILESDLSFPEGVATAEVLQAGDAHREGGDSSSIKSLVYGGIVACFKNFYKQVYTYLRIVLSTGFFCRLDGCGFWWGFFSCSDWRWVHCRLPRGDQYAFGRAFSLDYWCSSLWNLGRASRSTKCP